MNPGPSQPQPFTGAILTGGASTRMGRDKATQVTVDGQPLAARVASTLRAAGAAEVLAIGGDTAALTALGLDVRPDRHPGEGPLGGILTAFAAAAHPLVVVTACDLPQLRAEVIVALVAAAATGGDVDAAVACTPQREPLCAAWWAPRCHDHLQHAFSTGERAVHRALAGLGVRDVPVPAAVLRNVNTAQDLLASDPPPAPD
ncbi:MAG TPA: molybdenum cofactor guanylyltransferase [Acidimicrobiales bacterium]|nr:molybdenum cofactor guanylyltransferase [Acidimicrobiales bacterium]